MKRIIFGCMICIILSGAYAVTTGNVTQLLDKTRIDAQIPITGNTTTQTLEKAKTGAQSVSNQTSGLQVGKTSGNSLSTAINDQRQINPGFPTAK